MLREWRHLVLGVFFAFTFVSPVACLQAVHPPHMEESIEIDSVGITKYAPHVHRSEEFTEIKADEVTKSMLNVQNMDLKGQYRDRGPRAGPSRRVPRAGVWKIIGKS